MGFTEKETYALTNGVEIPIIGFGTWQTPDGDVAENAVLTAIGAGYRHIDTAAVYGNEVSVGKAIKKSGVPREELFITTKLWNDAHDYEDAKKALDASLKKLDLDYVDLYMIHWPNPLAVRDSWEKRNQDVWRAMEEALAEGKARALGVSNFHPHHLDSLLETAKVKPQVNQIYLCPSDSQDFIVEHNRRHGIVTEAYSPLGTGTLLDVEEMKQLATKYNKSVAQVAIRWNLQKGNIPLPKSVTPQRIRENLDVFDFEITDADMAIIDGLKGCAKVVSNPDKATF